MRKLRLALALGACCFALVGCAALRPVGSDEYAGSSSEITGPDTRPGVLGPNGISFGGQAGQSQSGDGAAFATIGVNSYTWRGVLDTLSFMPLESADPYGGVVMTDWYQLPSTPGERFKVNAYIVGKQLQSNSVRLVLFRQIRRANGWDDVPVSQAMTRQLQDKILARALALKAQEARSG